MLDATLKSLIDQPVNTLTTKVGNDSMKIPVHSVGSDLLISVVIVRTDGNAFSGTFAADFAGIVVHTMVPPTADSNAVCTALVPIALLPALEDEANLAVTTPDKFRPSMNLNHPECGTRTFWTPAAVTGLPTGTTGTGVVIGMADTAFDLTCDDFKNANGTTRVRYAWVQGDWTGTPPPGLYGREYSNTQIDSAIPASILTSADNDGSGHGTAVLGAAAGNGRATGNGFSQHRYPGMAPNATIIIVQVLGYSSNSFIDACAYVFAKAAELGLPAVFLLPVEAVATGPNDGKDPLSLALTGLQGAGKIVVCAAGNRGLFAKKHGKVTVPVGIGQTKTMQISFPAHYFSGAQFVNFMLWYDLNRSVSLKLISPNGYVFGPFSSGNRATPYSPHPDVYQLQMNFYTQTFGKSVDLKIGVPGTNGANVVWTIEVANLSDSLDAPVDAWMSPTSGGQAMLALCEFIGNSLSYGGYIGAPGAAKKVITVGSYAIRTSPVPGADPTQVVFENLKTSSQGPTRDGRTKPEICASGNVVSSMNSRVLSWGLYYPEQIADDGAHVHMSGTSLSAAIVAGACALMLELSPTHTYSTIVSKLYEDAVTDSFTDDTPTGGPVPNQQWGRGKARFIKPGGSVGGPPTKWRPERD